MKWVKEGHNNECKQIQAKYKQSIDDICLPPLCTNYNHTTKDAYF